jgi:hypothetical protein
VGCEFAGGEGEDGDGGWEVDVEGCHVVVDLSHLVGWCLDVCMLGCVGGPLRCRQDWFVIWANAVDVLSRVDEKMIV